MAKLEIIKQCLKYFQLFEFFILNILALQRFSNFSMCKQLRYFPAVAINYVYSSLQNLPKGFFTIWGI